MSEDLNKASLSASEKLNSKLLESERRYLAEKQRLQKEEAEEESRIKKREYIEKLATAKNNLAIEKATRNERLRLQKEANEQYLAELKAQADREREIFEQLKDDIADTYDDILSYADSSIVAVEEKRQKMQSKLSSYGNLSKKVTFVGAGENGEDEVYTDLVDLDKTTEVLSKYADNLVAIRDKMASGGVDSVYINSLVSAVSGLSIDKGLAFTSELISKSDGEFNKYIQSFIRKEDAVKSLSSEIYSAEMSEAVESTVEYMKQELEKMGLDVPEGFFLSGTVSAQRFGDAFVEEIETQLARIQNIIGGYNFSVNVDANKASGNTSVYSPTYQINSSGDTTYTLSKIKEVETRKILSGIV